MEKVETNVRSAMCDVRGSESEPDLAHLTSHFDRICRLLPFEITDGPTNMATDEVLLHSALSGVASLRFYGWSPPTLSLGYFQKAEVLQNDPLLAALPFVRRPSGGDTLVHHHEVTYALALPPGPWQQGKPWLLRMHEIIVKALATLGVNATLQVNCDRCDDGPLCYRHLTPGDVTIGGHKIVGSAQRKHRGALLQHGGILLGCSPHTPTLLGIRELTGRDVSPTQIVDSVTHAFAAEMEAQFREHPLNGDEREVLRHLSIGKFASTDWNQMR